MNLFTFTGNLGKDAEVKYLDNKQAKLKLRFLINKAVYLRMMGDRDQSRATIKDALAMASVNKDSLFWKARVHYVMGTIADDESDIDTAIEYHLIALRYAEAIDNKSLIATVNSGIGRAYLFIAEYDKAKENYKTAIAIKEELGQRDVQLASYYTNISNCYDAVGDYETSLQPIFVKAN